MNRTPKFEIGTICKQPSNTLGVYQQYCFGTLDGIEVGSPCDSESESKQNVIEILDQTLPYKLEDFLQENVDWLRSIIAENNRPDALHGWNVELKRKEALITKIKAYRASI